MSYAEVNGINLYYEIHGSGKPVILLHGGLGSGEMFTPMLPAFTADHQVILPDLQGHGRTADIDRPISLPEMARDVAALIDHLGLVKPHVVGFSLGAGVALRLAIAAPEKVGRLVSGSAGIRRSAFFPELLEQQAQVNGAAAEFMKDTPMYELYQRVAPRPEDFPRLLDKIGASMQQDYDLTEEIRGLRVPTMIVGADADMVPASHWTEVFALLDGGRRDGGWDRSGRPKGGHALAIIPGTTHYDILDSPLFAPIALSFLTQD
ncbi:alpha/beta fold hydrolase [Actinoplanes couchii]|uniref:Alpha/beta hydrolase n=1 Tax=Actinoplanes couchii TaxID=403638 RepID=A0ABQ3X1P9_9ACTN|nr:alpha/beta hydrolase [Actinoplanes couchii]MDR6316714.1 pimeloyl-ACP methyl ester carboxylesterase [Actinoplanes couchii]GID52323.1 alpha/beta hydrolase [Actinoplanes couchii]